MVKIQSFCTFDLIYNLKSNYYEVAVVGENALEKVKQINSKYVKEQFVNVAEFQPKYLKDFGAKKINN